jgi:hypothetical protein
MRAIIEIDLMMEAVSISETSVIFYESTYTEQNPRR